MSGITARKRVIFGSTTIGLKGIKKRKEEIPELRPTEIQHPLGLEPLGNGILQDEEEREATSRRRREQMGYFWKLPDELVVEILSMLDAEELRSFGYTSRVLNAFAFQDDLWKELVARRGKATEKWYGSWRRTYFKIENEGDEFRPICQGFFSDVLYRPYFCQNLNVAQYLTTVVGLANTKIPQFENLSQEQFDEEWSLKPFMLTDLEWPEWDISDLVKLYKDTEFVQECMRWKLGVYADYMANNQDESPLYLFDREFAEKTDMAREYTVPSIFQTDYFSALDTIRPDYRWLIVGPERSGSTFHKDPNATSAWNAVVQGEKYWVMFPPNVLPPGVYTSEDESSVTSPLSIAEWLIEFHKEAMNTPGFQHGICKKGQVLYVPSGWWHLVVNLSPTIALTQNFVPVAHITSVLKFFYTKKDQISGFHSSGEDDDETPENDILLTFLDRLESPAMAISKKMQDRIKAWKEKNLNKFQIGSKWDRLIESKQLSFSFGFNDEQFH
ncbi:uncharacterized protein V1516DRAFT_673386 [Lipomyces oligophaga]|uniref:uncharacterized protein n=1 Tax=Lipomyces oligophaga TaxID=45792 RepID=UPI0034CD2ABB